ncbi:MAG: hypothetical protein AAGC74_07790 [Verrucomicrobiota bacterium]
MVRSFLNGRFENTAFCVLAPDGKTRLSGTGRGPHQALAGPRRGRPDGGGRSTENDSVINELESISKRYRERGKTKDQTLQDFHSFRQALNVASGDQRLLIIASEKNAHTNANLKAVLNRDNVMGRFHIDTLAASDHDWTNAVSDEKGKSGLFIIRPDSFGQKGTVLAQLPLTASSSDILSALGKANATYAKTENRKVYSDHIRQGRRTGVYFENEMPYGEDRDADGIIDHRPRRR